MKEWVKIEDELPPDGVLVLVYQDMTGKCLRSRSEEGNWYDENNNFDDSELDITHWSYLLEDPSEE